ncbi:MAG: cob(I)yrinic acid a,c-diamide adenosyltransferase [Candidatus Methanoplasma sp.]|jgi:cob(I)alamin adenosyltransferase|nr:cob(I)yrinic acid a,c-diamide adenosyltransferase [Candidatus Methanoplasma sp.]
MSHLPPNIKNELGLVHVYTGDGKGKTTASLGLAFRAAGRGLEVLMIQFLKPPEDYGEHISASRMNNFTILPLGLDHMVSKVPKKEDVAVSEAALAKAKGLMHSGAYDLVILDEINVAVSWGLLSAGKVLDVLKNRPPNTEVVLTGRGAPPEIIEYADLVTEMRPLKHPFDKGVHARMGIEF